MYEIPTTRIVACRSVLRMTEMERERREAWRAGESATARTAFSSARTSGSCSPRCRRSSPRRSTRTSRASTGSSHLRSPTTSRPTSSTTRSSRRASRTASGRRFGELERTAFEERLSQEELESWLGAIESLRLTLGTQLDVSDETYLTALDPDDPELPRHHVYHWLSWLQEEVVEALSSGLRATEPMTLQLRGGA